MKKLISLILLCALACGQAAADELCYPSGVTGEPVYYSNDRTSVNAGELFDQLKTAPFVEDVKQAVPDNLRYTGSVYSGGIYEILLESTSSVENTDFAAFLGRTLAANTPAECVNITMNGRFLCRYPENAGCVVYYPESSGMYVFPVLRAVDGEITPQKLTTVLSASFEGYITPIPGNTDGIAWTYTYESDGRRALCIDFPMNVFTALESTVEARWQFLACTALTMLSNLSGIDCVKVSFDGQTVSGVPDRDGVLLRIADSCIDRNCLAGYTGCEVAPDCYVGAADSLNPGAILHAVLPGVVAVNDVTGFEKKDGILYVSLSHRFFESCRGMTAMQEKKTVYGIVNALCRNLGVKKVCLLAEGQQVSTLSGSICLEGALMPSFD